jgi:HD-like signal output (HDOD) protein
VSSVFVRFFRAPASLVVYREYGSRTVKPKIYGAGLLSSIGEALLHDRSSKEIPL